MKCAKWRKLISSTVLTRSSQTLSVVGTNAYIYGGELRSREPVDSDVHIVDLRAGTSRFVVLDACNPPITINHLCPLKPNIEGRFFRR